MNVSVNGERRTLSGATTLGALLREIGVSANGIAVALNARVVARSLLESQPLAEGDEIEIVRAVSGG